jgi:hypothetical protein
VLHTLSRYWHTLRYLRPAQVYGQVRSRLPRPSPNLAAAPALRKRSGAWQPPARREPVLVGPEEFLIFGRRGRLSQQGWHGPEHERLWRYNQHYFDDLNAHGAEARVRWHEALLDDWVRRNPPGSTVGWDPYPTSIRIVNWIKWVLAGNELPGGCLHSLAVQVRWLSKRLETHLLGNHLFANAKALVFAGVFFNGDEADRWLHKGNEILAREVPEQILPDGGHIERSPMYHLIVMEDMLDLVNLHGAYGIEQPPDWLEAVTRMFDWAQAMQHPDSRISFFNDAAFGVAAEMSELNAYARRLRVGSNSPSALQYRHLQSSGYARLTVPGAVLLVDMAPIGPDYLPGHAHGDTLSFELSLGNRRIVVNGGTSTYEAGPERSRQRSTAAHSALVVDHEDSSEVWSAFRVARRARVFNQRVWVDNGTVYASASHDGYKRLVGRPIHTRTWVLSGSQLQVLDEVTGRGVHRVDIIFLLAPDCVPEVQEEGRVEVRDRTSGSPIVTLFAGIEPNVVIDRAAWHCRFGSSEDTWRVRLVREGALPLRQESVLTWPNAHPETRVHGPAGAWASGPGLQRQ